MYDENSNKGRTRSWVKMLTRTFVSIIWKTVEQWHVRVSDCRVASALAGDGPCLDIHGPGLWEKELHQNHDHQPLSHGQQVSSCIKVGNHPRVYLTLNIVKLRQGSTRDCSQGERPQSPKPCLDLTLKLVVTHHHQKLNFTQLMAR